MASNDKHYVMIEVLQNGYPVSATRSPLSRSKTFFLSNKRWSPLGIPFYPVAEDVPLFKVKNNHVHILSEVVLSGFVRTKGRVRHLTPTNSKNIHLSGGDLASLVYRDLRILLKIDKPSKKIKADRSHHLVNDYRTGPLTLWFLPSEIKNILISMIVTLSTFVGLIWFVLPRPVIQDHQFEYRIKETYLLPFISQKHYAFGPETFQQNYKPDKLTPMLYEYYNSLADIMMGKFNNVDKSILPSTVERSKKNYSLYQTKIEQVRQQAKVAGPAIGIPTAVGEPAMTTSDRVIDHIRRLHLSFEVNLERRAGALASFNQDKVYEFENYLTPDAPAARMNSYQVAYLKKMQLGDKLTPEARMYIDAKSKGDQAIHLRRQLQIKALTEEEQENLAPIYLDISSQTLSPLIATFDEQTLTKIKTVPYAKHTKIVKPIRKVKLAQEHINPVLRANRQFLRLCYERALGKKPNLKGKMLWSWEVNSLGVTSDIVLENTSIKDLQMIECVKNAISRFHFVKSNQYDTASANFLFDFSPESF